jgi:hypothetical protein
VQRRNFLLGSLFGGLAAITDWKGTMTKFTTSLLPGDSIDVSGSDLRVAPTSTLVTVSSPAVVTPPPPSSGSWFAYPGPIPAGKSYDGKSSLATFLKSLPAGGVGILDYDGDRVENVSVSLQTGVKVYAAAGRRPWVRGTFTISGGNSWSIYGLSVHYPEISGSGHMLTVSAGSGWEFAYGEVAYANCYTLIHPADTIANWRVHHCWVHDNLGVSSHDGYQDHGFYCSAPSASQNGRIDHCLIENMPRGRNVKIGTSGSAGTPGNITVDKCTLRLGHGPSNGQVSNGATNDHFTNCVLIDSGSSTNLTAKSSPGTGSTYSGNWSDETTGPNNSNLKDAGGNVVKARTTLMDYAANGAAGKGHLAS